jgi:predicted GNAT family acetyltransferase
MEIRHSFDGGYGEFFIEENGERIAEMTYTKSGDGEITIDHTQVSPARKGRGIARKLVVAGVAHARVQKLKIVPVCSYVRAEFERNPEYADVWVR